MVGIGVVLLEETKCSQFALSVGNAIYEIFNSLKINFEMSRNITGCVHGGRVSD